MSFGIMSSRPTLVGPRPFEAGSFLISACRSGRCEGWTSARTHANSEFGGFFLPAEILTCSFFYGFPDNLKHRDQKQPDTACRDHAGEDGCTDGMPRDLRCTGGPDE